MSRTGRTIRRHLVLVGALFLATASLVLAQTATGVIRGTVQDPTAAVVGDVQVTLVDEATDQRREQRTNEEGLFEFRTLPFGTYRIEAEQPGFKKVVIEDVALEVAQTAVVNIALQVGTVNDHWLARPDRYESDMTLVVQAATGLRGCSSSCRTPPSGAITLMDGSGVSRSRRNRG